MHRPSYIPTRDYICNQCIAKVPFHDLRMWFYRCLGLHAGSATTILMNVQFQGLEQVEIGNHTVINPWCYIDGRGGLKIGSNVNISSHVLIVAGTHDPQDPVFAGSAQPIVIEDYVWICTAARVLAGIRIGKGAVVAAGAVVSENVAPYDIVAGVPARKIGERTQALRYELSYPLSWT